MQAVADSLYGNTYQMTGLNTAEKHLSPLIHQVWQIQMKKKYTLALLDRFNLLTTVCCN